MSTRLYLDTARLGRMCPEAQAADLDFARLASEEGCSLYFENFLRWGYMALPPPLARRYPGLSFWAGVGAFKNDLKAALCLPPDRKVLLANRSAQLVRLAARLLCHRCENILVTDMEWPAYLQTLSAECGRMGRRITTVPMREAVFRDRIGQAEAAQRLFDCYRAHDCDGLFLSLVTYHGVQMPLRGFLEALPPRQRPRFVVLDGAQAVNHVPLGMAADCCDLLLAGCHKWLCAYQPLGLAVCCRPASLSLAMETCHEMQRSGAIDDPLLVFSEQLENHSAQPYSETVNLAPMFTAAAAVRRMLASPRPKREELAAQIANADRVADRSATAGWQPARPALPMRSGILLLEPRHPETRLAPVDALRERFLRAGVALTAYAGGTVRVSLPDRPLAAGDLSLLDAALCRCA